MVSIARLPVSIIRSKGASHAIHIKRSSEKKKKRERKIALEDKASVSKRWRRESQSTCLIGLVPVDETISRGRVSGWQIRGWRKKYLNKADNLCCLFLCFLAFTKDLSRDRGKQETRDTWTVGEHRQCFLRYSIQSSSARPTCSLINTFPLNFKSVVHTLSRAASSLNSIVSIDCARVLNIFTNSFEEGI